MEPEGDESLREALILRIDEADVEDAEVLGNGDLHPKIRVRDLRRKSEEGTTLLSGVSVDIWKGTVVGVIGPSGSGKSTFLRALNRLWEPSADSVFLDYNDITKIDVMTLRRRVGMLFQTPALFEGSVAENIRFGPALRGEKLSDEEVVKYLGLADLDSSLASRSVSGLSVGQAQRVALARTLANEPEVLLLDEPTSALDPISTQHIEESIVKLRKNKGMTIIMVSHSVKQIQRIADVVFLLVGGQIVETLKPDQLSNANHPMARTFLDLFPEKQRHKKNRVAHYPTQTTHTFTVGTFDGAAQRGISGGGGTLNTIDGRIFHFKVGLGHGTNNRAELLALWSLLWLAKYLQITEIEIFGDSKLIIDWVNGRTTIRQVALTHWFQKVMRLKEDFESISLFHHYREYNFVADILSKEALSLDEGTLLLKEAEGPDPSLWKQFSIY